MLEAIELNTNWLLLISGLIVAIGVIWKKLKDMRALINKPVIEDQQDIREELNELKKVMHENFSQIKTDIKEIKKACSDSSEVQANVLKDKIKKEYNLYTERQWCSIEEKEDFCKSVELYKDVLKLNSVKDDMRKTVLLLADKPPQERKRA